MISLATLPAGRKLIIIARLSWNPAAAAAKWRGKMTSRYVGQDCMSALWGGVLRVYCSDYDNLLSAEYEARSQVTWDILVVGTEPELRRFGK